MSGRARAGQQAAAAAGGAVRSAAELAKGVALKLPCLPCRMKSAQVKATKGINERGEDRAFKPISRAPL